MTNNELLLAISDMMDKKLKSEIQAELQLLKACLHTTSDKAGLFIFYVYESLEAISWIKALLLST